jgi:hypothetical protein
MAAIFLALRIASSLLTAVAPEESCDAIFATPDVGELAIAPPARDPNARTKNANIAIAPIEAAATATRARNETPELPTAIIPSREIPRDLKILQPA